MRRWVGCIFVLFGLSAATAAAQDARTVAAQAELRTLADALDTCAIFSGVYVSLESLNDVTFQTNNPVHDWINLGGGAFVMRPSVGRFELDRRVFTDGGFLDPDAWQGPFVSFQQGRTQTLSTPYDQGSPLDPWGHPYLFYSPLGLVRGDGGAVTFEFHGDAFDRYTLVSLGADSLVSSDDITRPFGGAVTGFALSSIRGASVGYDPAAPDGPAFSAPLAAPVTLRGTSLGATQAGTQVLFGTTDITAAVADWRVVSDGFVQRVEIDLTLPFELRGQGEVTVRRGAAQTNALTLQLPLVNAAEAWRLYP
jgi:hypothetical protein